MTPHRRPARPFLRWLLLVGLVLGGVFQPMLAAMGELHEFTHGLSEQHLHDGGDVQTELDEAGDRADGTLHLIHHFAHCCGQLSAMLVPSVDLPVAAHDTSPVLPGSAQRVLSDLAPAPFRPPIRA